MLKIKQAIIVEGRYDKSKLSSLVDATIVTTGGFDIFHNEEKMRLIRTLAAENGIIILTDSDAAGFKIRGYLAGAINPKQITHVYIPDVFGKEHRKLKPSAEGKLGVEGLSASLLLEAFARAGISVENESCNTPISKTRPITKADFMEWGLSGRENSTQLRRKLLKKLNFPTRMSANAMLQSVNALYSYDEFIKLLPK